jgi:Aldehyde dehydrogenase family
MSYPACQIGPSVPYWAQVRFMARGFVVSGDHQGQQSSGYRWPYGPVALITPFNFPLEIPALQLMGALFMGNKPLLHVDRRCRASLAFLEPLGTPLAVLACRMLQRCLRTRRAREGKGA